MLQRNDRNTGISKSSVKKEVPVWSRGLLGVPDTSRSRIYMCVQDYLRKNRNTLGIFTHIHI